MFFFKEVMQQYICSTKQVVFQRVKHDQQVGKQFLGIQPKERKPDVHREIHSAMNAHNSGRHKNDRHSLNFYQIADIYYVTQ